MTRSLQSHPAVGPDRPRRVIEPATRGFGAYLAELWLYRELIFFLVWRDVKVRYKQTALGVIWVVMQPLLSTIIFSVALGALADIPSDGVPYPLFVMAALLPWQIFSLSISDMCHSLVQNEHLISKIYFPRLIIALSPICARLFDFAITAPVLVGLQIFYGVRPSAALLALPLFLLLVIQAAAGVGLWLATLNLRFRDVGYTIPFLTQFLMFATPVVYPSSLVPEAWRTLYALNPMVGVVDGFRWSLLGTGEPPLMSTLLSALVGGTVLLSALLYFRQVEATFADIV
ncbi:MAG TPA: ABC transporter permease [Chloroflexaceae bacterium]|nr:ABC transporter permease [Chloroflexaceae bacterium]